MTIGIYAIYWSTNDADVYIGQSNNIQRRHAEHISTLKNNTHRNYKIQSAYNIRGEPDHYIIEECTSAELDSKEQYWIEEFDSFNNGYNLNPGGYNHSAGINNPASIYSEAQLEGAFKLLVNSKETILDISKTTGVGVGILKCISTGKNHTWLSTRYPEEWDMLISSRRKVENKPSCKVYPVVRVQNKNSLEVYTISSSIREFANKYGLYESHLAAVIRKDRKSHKGFILYED